MRGKKRAAAARLGGGRASATLRTTNEVTRALHKEAGHAITLKPCSSLFCREWRLRQGARGGSECIF